MDAASPSPADFGARIAERDLSLFQVQSQTKPEDKASLLAIQALVRGQADGYAYIEVGSHLGGTLTPHLQDPRCRSVVSIDARPASQPDVRGRVFDYPENSSARMIRTLHETAPGADLGKLVAFDTDASQVDAVAEPASLIFIDGEHTNTAVFRDFLSTWRFARPDSVIAFHDSNLIFDGLQNIEALLDSQGVAHASFFLPLNVFALAAGEFIGPAREHLGPLAHDRDAFIAASRDALWDEIVASRAPAGRDSA